MRAFEGIFIVATVVVACAASENASSEATVNVTTEATTNDKSNETQTILGCLGDQMRRAIDLSKNNTKEFLRVLSPKGELNKTWDVLNAEYGNLQRNIENTTQIIVADRKKCEADNDSRIIRRNCDLLAKLAYVQKNSKLLTVFMGKSIQIIVKAGLQFHLNNIWGNTFRFAKEQNRLLLQTVTNAVSCISQN